VKGLGWEKKIMQGRVTGKKIVCEEKVKEKNPAE